MTLLLNAGLVVDPDAQHLTHAYFQGAATTRWL